MATLRNFNGLVSWRNAENSLQSVNLTMPLGQYTGYLRTTGVDGAISRSTGDVQLIANFDLSKVSFEHLNRPSGLILEADLTGNTFEGTKIVRLNETEFIQAEGATASIAGGFFGGNAGEVGGAYEVIGGAEEHTGRFVGAFGAKPNNSDSGAILLVSGWLRFSPEVLNMADSNRWDIWRDAGITIRVRTHYTNGTNY